MQNVFQKLNLGLTKKLFGITLNDNQLVSMTKNHIESDYPILTVSQLSNAIKHSLETTFPLVWLQGEVSNCKLNTSGHLYFSIKDTYAQITAVMFRPDVALLKSIPKDGAQIIVRGEINVYPASGKYQILVRELRLVGLGELLLQLEELKIKLHKLGWFRAERKRPLPKFPKKIGVVTSPTGAAIQDMLNILSRRFSGFHLILNPVRVQGEGAAKEIAQAIEQFNHYNLVDVMIVGRGGGSVEDLWAFNEEIVAAAIFKSRIPIISAVGHETDHCIADYVADVRAPTPSAAAELVIAEKTQQLQHLALLQKRIKQTILQLIKQDRHRLQSIVRHPQIQSPYGIVGSSWQLLDSLKEDLEISIRNHLRHLSLRLENKRQLLYSLQPKTKLLHHRQKLAIFEKDAKAAILRHIQSYKLQISQKSITLSNLWKSKQTECRAQFLAETKIKQLDHLVLRFLAHKRERLAYLKESLDTINPKNLLTKGYCILFSEKDSSVITSIESVTKNQNVKILVSDGHLKANINDIIHE